MRISDWSSDVCSSDLFVADAEPVDLLALESDETRQELRPVRLQGRRDAPIFLCPEQLDLALAIDDQAERHRLHPAGRLGAGTLAPHKRLIARASGRERGYKYV